MGKSSFKTGSSPGRRREFQRPTAIQLLRQLGLIAAVLVVWSVLLAGFIKLASEPAEQPVSEALPPIEAPTATATSTAPPATETRPSAPKTTSGEEAAPTATEPAEKAASATPPPPPTNTPPPEPTEAPPPSESTVSFAGEVLPILESRCVQCHGGSRSEGGLQLNTYQAVMADSDNGPSVLPGDAAHSLLVDLIVSGKMPRRGPTLTPAEIQTITDWVNAGSPDN